MRSKVAIFGLTFPVIMVFDFMTKRWALDALGVRSSELFGGLVPLTLAYNKGAAFGVRLGEDSRWFFVPVTIIALALLGVLFKQAANRDFLRVGSISLVVSGAIGNLWDRSSPWPTWRSPVAPCCSQSRSGSRSRWSENSRRRRPRHPARRHLSPSRKNRAPEQRAAHCTPTMG